MILSARTNKLFVFALFALLVLLFGLVTFHTLDKEFEHEAVQKRFVSGDSKHYLFGATEIVSDGFTFDYIKRYPHREILYPAALAVPLSIFGQNLLALGAVNIFFFCLSALFAFLIVKKFSGDSLAALFAAGLILFNKFTFFNVTYELLTEGMFIACVLAAVYLFLCCLKAPQRKHLLWLAAACGIAQGIRPNGFFMFAAFLALLATQRFLPKHGRSSRYAVMTSPASLFWACLVFVLCSAPSWAPRLYFFGNPLHHGYLPNYLWADTYAQAHDSGLTYTFMDFFRTHSIGDLPGRILFGIKKSFVFWPQDYISMTAWLALVAGLVIAAWEKNKSMLLLAATYFIMMAPIVWTVCSNPTPRIGFAYTLPFSALFGAYALAFLRPRLLPGIQWLSEVMANAGKNVQQVVTAAPDLHLRTLSSRDRGMQPPFAQPPFARQAVPQPVLERKRSSL